MGLPEVVLNTGFRALRQARVSSGKIGERWSSIGTAMARRTRSGTLVGPGTNRKLRPAICVSSCAGIRPLIVDPGRPSRVTRATHASHPYKDVVVQPSLQLIGPDPSNSLSPSRL